MTAESMLPARGSTPSRGLRSRSRLRAARWWPVLVAVSALVAACDDDERATLSRSDGTSRAHAVAGPLAQAVSAAPATISTGAILASPAQPLKQAGATAPSAAAPLAPPVIHTAD